mmetsp:Transcript_20991/g.59550  ORF Transcript_20991/g.59550 Transcript_20991/m.59550 type:complete len:207 (-) Transcript_20991:139-759(-)
MPHAHVVLVDLCVPRAAAQHVLVPCEGSDAIAMALEGAELALRTDVPDLHLAVRGADGHVVALARPPHRRDVASVKGEELLCLARLCVEEVDRLRDGHADDVVGGPIDGVAVEVVDDVGRIEDPHGRLRHHAAHCRARPRARVAPGAVQHLVVVTALLLPGGLVPVAQHLGVREALLPQNVLGHHLLVLVPRRQVLVVLELHLVHR